MGLLLILISAVMAYYFMECRKLRKEKKLLEAQKKTNKKIREERLKRKETVHKHELDLYKKELEDYKQENKFLNSFIATHSKKLHMHRTCYRDMEVAIDFLITKK